LSNSFNEVELQAYVEIKRWPIETTTVSHYNIRLNTFHLISDLWTDINGRLFILQNCFIHTFLLTLLRQHDTFVALQKLEINFGREKTSQFTPSCFLFRDVSISIPNYSVLRVDVIARLVMTLKVQLYWYFIRRRG